VSESSVTSESSVATESSAASESSEASESSSAAESSVASESSGATESSAASESSSSSGSAVDATYSCTTSIGANFSPTVTFSGATPPSVAPGATVNMTGFQVAVTVPASIVNTVRDEGFTSASGSATTVDVDSNDANSTTVNAAATPIPIPSQPLIAGHAVLITLPASPVTIGSWTAIAVAGRMEFTTGPIVLHLIFKGAETLDVPVTCSPTTVATISTTRVPSASVIPSAP